MSKRTDKDYVLDIYDSIGRILTYTSGFEYVQLFADTKTQDAVIRNLEIIGEAAKGVSEQLQKRHPEVPWRRMAATRDRLIHGYFGVNLEIVWDIIVQELPRLQAQIHQMLEE
ncbi:MAG: DUF86 domain-containing protein [Anaerolineales bacterium]